MNKITVIIDGSNFYHRSKRMCPKVHLTNFGYRGMVEKIIGRVKSRIIYCVGEIKREPGNKKSETMYAQQQSMFYHLEKQKIEVFKGYMLKSDGKYHEKGVDVWMAVEIVKGALKDEYDCCYLFSSDTDIIPAILEAKLVGKEVVYVGFDNSLSRAMVKNCARSVVIKKEMLGE